MKKLLRWHTLAIISTALMLGCSSNPEPEPGPTPPPVVNPTLELAPASLDFLADDAPKTFTVKANGAWTISSDQNWCTLAPESGSGDATVTVTVAKHEGMEVRPATVTAKRETLTKTISIKQLGEAPAILISGDEPFLAADGGSINITVTTNIPYDVAISDSWLTAEQAQAASKVMASHEHKFSAQPYTGTTAPRFSDITFKGKDVEQTIKATQLTAAPTDVVDLYIKEADVVPATAVNNEGGVVGVQPSTPVAKVDITQPWIRQIASSDAVQRVKTKAAPGSIIFVVDPNTGESRSGFAFLIGTNGKIDTLQFKQIGIEPAIVPTVDSLTMATDGGSFKFNVLANTEYAASSANDWITIVSSDVPGSKAADLTKSSVEIQVAPNANLENRRGVVTLKQKNGEAKTEVVVNQKGYGKTSMVITKKNVSVSAAAQSLYVDLQFKAGKEEFTVDIDVDWISQITEAGYNQNFDISANTEKATRVGKVIFKQVGSSSTDTLTVTQLGAIPNDGTSRATDSVAIIDVLNGMARYDKNYAWPAGQSITTPNRWFSTREVDGEQRIEVFNAYLPQFNTYNPDKYATLSPSIWKLTKLRQLFVNGAVKGTISEDLGKMTNLEYLSISEASVGGDIPKSIGNLKLLTLLEVLNAFSDINGLTNPVTSIPEEVGELNLLSTIGFTTNVTKLPQSIAKLENLKRIKIRQIGKATLDLLPESMGQSQNLEEVEITSSDGGVHNLPDGIFKPSLRLLNIQTDSPLPSSVANTNLEGLYVSGNYTTILQPGVRMPQTVKELGLYSEKLTEMTDEMLSSNLELFQINIDAVNTISPKLASLTRLRELMLINYGAPKDFPKVVCNIQSLKSLSLLGVKGKLPEEITNLTNLTHFQLLSWGNNAMEGVISDSQWRFFLKNLGSKIPQRDGIFRLVLNDNRFTGTIPDFVLESDSWTKEIHPSEGSWFPFNTIVPQQPGYGFDNYPEWNSSARKSNVQGKAQFKRDSKGVYQMISVK